MNAHQRRRDNRGRGRKAAAGNGGVEIRVVETPREIRRFDRLMGERHKLGPTPRVGDFLRQAAVIDGEWVALLAWGPSALRLKDRDEWIGWSARMRKERQKLVVQNRRFCLLGEKGEFPNRASQVLAAAVRVLPQQWEDAFGYRPAVAESFTDLEGQAGTSYKASGWEPVGRTAGYSRHRADFYVENGRPKKLWMKDLSGGGRSVLCAPDLPAEMKKAVVSGHGALPLSVPKVRSLMETLWPMPDSRGSNARFRIGSVLTIVGMALLAGYRDLASVHRFGLSLDQKDRQRLRLPVKRGKFRDVPSYSVYYRVLGALDLDALAAILSAWLQAHAGELPGALALDGKMVRDTLGILSLSDHDTGVPILIAPMRNKTDDDPRSELKVAQACIKNLDLAGRTVTADALHAQAKTFRTVHDANGDYLIQIKGNQPTALRYAKSATDGRPPFLSTPSPDTDESRSGT